MLIVVTGGSGFVGRHLISALRRRRPEATVRSFDARPPDGEHPHGVETAVGSIEDEEAVHGAVAGADVVVHLAARVAPEAGDSEQLWRVNVGGYINAAPITFAVDGSQRVAIAAGVMLYVFRL